MNIFLNADETAPDGIKISCLHCKKQFAYRGFKHVADLPFAA